jgi:hypothetical protein
MRRTFAFCGFGLLAVIGCSSTDDDTTTAPPEKPLDTAKVDPGALVAVSMPSQVGVVLDEIPASIRDRVAAALIARPSSFWEARAHRQMTMTYYRLVFRPGFYPPGVNHGKANATGQTNPVTGSMQKQQLPLPPESNWTITFQGVPQRVTVDGHDLVAVNFNFSATLLTDFASPGVSEPSLADIGGVWNEPFTLPIDPELVFQRTRFACMDEAEFPPGSVDAEEVDSFYDSTCTIESQLSQTGCHQTELPPWNCVDAVKARIGHIDTKLRFERLKWDQTIADRNRSGPITSTTGADLLPEASEFRVNRVTYRYIPPNDCAIVEKCVAGTGWRKLLQFATADRNTGTSTMNIGQVDYFNNQSGSPVSLHNVFEYSSCHKHFHFSHYGTFSFAGNAALTAKRGFCLQSTNRLSNNEYSPLHNPYPDCHYQGVDVGWVDEYKAGLPCQWIDVTSVGAITGELKFVSNPDSFLCEGTPILDSLGNQVWVPALAPDGTPFTSSSGAPIQKQACTYSPGYLDNNTDAYNVSLPATGDGYVTKPCNHGQLGPLRNCGFSVAKTSAKVGATALIGTCMPGASVTVHCSIPAGSAPQVVRLCEASAALGSGVACTHADALANASVDTSGADVTFTCPAARDAVETGGTYSLYTAPVFEDDAAQTVTCN